MSKTIDWASKASRLLLDLRSTSPKPDGEP
jgi:hypothetical protein